jgi:hypothetical protein
MGRGKEDSGFLVGNALENWTDIDWVAHRFINWKFYKVRATRVNVSRHSDPARKALIERKLHDKVTYRVEADGFDDTAIRSAPS